MIRDTARDTAQEAAQEVEYCIVVGAGSAGCVAAARLSEDSHRVVTLLEAGPDLTADAVPDTISGSDFLAALSEPARTYPDLSATRTTGGAPSPYVRGRGVGGSSAVNAMVALRGDVAQYESWGWADTATDWAAMELPEEVVDIGELGVVDRALMAAVPDAELAVLTRRDGRRVTSAEAYLWPAEGRDNLDVISDTPVDRVIVEAARATGVITATGEILAADRIVLAAGAIHTPAILLRSGVLVAGVGEGLQDHPSAPLTLEFREGVEHSTNGLVVGSLLRRGDVQLLPMNHLGPDLPRMGLLMVALMRPVGCLGTVRLASDDPLADPIVDFALLRDERDIAGICHGVRIAIEALGTAAFDDVVEHVYIDAWGTTIDSLHSDESVERWVLAVAGDYVHASSSCAMGAVVDSDGAVVGQDRLYVCDASAFPEIPSVNTHLPTTMLAERLARRWRQTW